MRRWKIGFGISIRSELKSSNPGEIYTLVQTVDGLAPLGEWNQGLLSTSYQWSRGLGKRRKEGRLRGQRSKTINAPCQLFTKRLLRLLEKKWLQEPITITKETPDKSVRAVWSEGKSGSASILSKRRHEGGQTGPASEDPGRGDCRGA